jgi:putative hydrolase of the HAD superfamily
MLKAVIFDLGDTLVKSVNLIETYRRILRARGIHRSQEELTVAHIEAGKILGLEHMKTMSDEYWIKRNNIFLEHIGVFGREDLARIISEQWWDYSDVCLFSDAVETFDQLKQRGIKMGVITNALQTDLSKIISKTKLNPGYFDIMVTVNTICRMKPEKEIFDYALNMLKVAPNETLFVGDTVEYDYEGARKAGLRAVLIDRERKVDGNIEKIHDLREILALI